VGVERKLAAILSADVKGYSRLMNDDEVGTLRTLTTYRKVMDTLIEQHRGRIVGMAGDSLLAEFASVVDAVQCAVVIQTTLKAENANVPSDRRMEFRIGINLGDVMADGEQIYGDGVNIAARLESLAEPGGLCISGTVHEHIKNKLALRYEDRGAQAVKNIAEPVRVLRVLLEPTTAALAGKDVLRRAQHERLEKRRVGTSHLSRPALVIVGLLIVGGVITLLYPSFRTIRTPQSEISNQKALPLPDKPSIAVLPFVNISNDPEQEYFSDGITEDLITDLSKLSGLFVIARNSVFTYKGKAVKVQEVSRELGVQYVLEDSVRKIGNRMLITAQLVDAPTGHHVWSERYDRELRDIFATQEEIRRKIVSYLAVRLTEGEQERAWHQYTSTPEAYDYLLRGVEYFNHFTKETNVQARQMYEKAIELNPTYAVAYATLSVTYLVEWFWQWSQTPPTLEQAFALAQKAIALDNSLALAHDVLGSAYAWKKQYDQAIVEGERAVVLAPNSADAHVWQAQILLLAGRPAEAVGLVEKAKRLNPQYPAWYSGILGWAYRLVGRYEEATVALKQALAHNPNDFNAHFHLAAPMVSWVGRQKPEPRGQKSCGSILISLWRYSGGQLAKKIQL
jgi:adenylate cyclase